MSDFEKIKKELGGDEWEEVGKDQMRITEWPKPFQSYKLFYETHNLGVEEMYYWIRDYIEEGLISAELMKVTDTFAASEHSSLFGVSQQRVGLQQDKISQFLATVGKMIKELFQIVREIRILDERLEYYNDSYSSSASWESAEITLKGNYVDLVEGGAKSPASVYGMAREVQFTTLPDLFFTTHPRKPEEIDTFVGNLDFNKKVKVVLKRKLRAYLNWKDHTYKELTSRRIFTIKYLRQHYEIIRMYATWVKPYLRNLKRMQSESMENKKKRDTDLISSFETSLMEVELLNKVVPEGNKKYFAILLLHLEFRTKPSLNYQQEGYNRGPLHVGEMKGHWRSYVWNDEEIQKYLKMREDEELELLGLIDDSVKAAIDALGEELQKYLSEAEGRVINKKKEQEKKEVPKMDVIEPFAAPFKGLYELFVPKSIGQKKTPKQVLFELEKEKKKAKADAEFVTWTLYKNFKKAHGMLAW